MLAIKKNLIYLIYLYNFHVIDIVFLNGTNLSMSKKYKFIFMNLR